MMLMIVFGAGASYDSYARIPPGTESNEIEKNARPPLADYLFDLRFHDVIASSGFIQPVMGLIHHLNRRSASLEEELERLMSGVGQSELRARQFLALRYYLKEVLERCSSQWLGL